MCFVPQGRRALSTQAQDDQRPIEATEAYSSCPEGPRATLGLLSNRVDLMASAVGRHPEPSRYTLGRTLSMQPRVEPRPGTNMHIPQQGDTISMPPPLARLFSRGLSLNTSRQPPARVPVRLALQPQFLATGLSLFSLSPGFPAVVLSSAPVTSTPSLPA